jgi:hypothetical protein
VRGDHRADLGHQVARGPRQRRIAPSGHPARAQHGRLDLVRRQHQRRHVEAGFQHVADARLAAHRHALGDQFGHVSIDGAQRGLQLLRHRGGGDRRSRAAQHLDDREQSLGASHGRQGAPSVLTAA